MKKINENSKRRERKQKSNKMKIRRKLAIYQRKVKIEVKAAK